MKKLKSINNFSENDSNIAILVPVIWWRILTDQGFFTMRNFDTSALRYGILLLIGVMCLLLYVTKYPFQGKKQLSNTKLENIMKTFNNIGKPNNHT